MINISIKPNDRQKLFFYLIVGMFFTAEREAGERAGR